MPHDASERQNHLSALTEPSSANGRVIVVVGPPNSGKGTQTRMLAEHFGAVYFSVGDLIRTENDPRIMAVHDSGALISSDDVRRLLKTKLESIPVEQTIVFDGAKKLEEARWLVDVLPGMGRYLERVVLLHISEQESRNRSSDRGRADDAHHLQDERWRFYYKDVVPAIKFYSELGVLLEVDAEGTTQEVADRVWEALGIKR